jgi:hypothetical protein
MTKHVMLPEHPTVVRKRLKGSSLSKTGEIGFDASTAQAVTT